MNTLIFVVILIFILSLCLKINCYSNENFFHTNLSDGVYNYFYQRKINPYSEHHNLFFSNDK